MKDYSLVNFEVKGDYNGSLVAVENNKNIPFEIKRVYYIWGTKKDVIRGKHAHKNLEQIIICVSGYCDFILDNGKEKKTIHLDNPSQGLYIKNNIWREFTNFSEDCVVVVLASQLYDENDYIRNYDDFLKNISKHISNNYNVLRDIEEDDAEFVLSLRCNEQKSKYLNKTNNNIEEQKQYIKKYKTKNNEWYFIIEDKNKQKLGTVRIYDVINNDDFCWGSWLIKDGAPITTSISSAILIYEYAFYKLGFTKVHFDVRKENKSVRRFHENFGAKIYKEDNLDVFYRFSKIDYEKIRNKYLKYL